MENNLPAEPPAKPKRIRRKRKPARRGLFFRFFAGINMILARRNFLLIASFLLGIIFVFLYFRHDWIFSRLRILDSNVFHTPKNVQPQGLNLVFYADEYESWNEFDSDVDSIMRNIKKVEPWKSYNRYNVYRIHPGTGLDICAVKNEDERKPVLRCDRRINEYFEQLNLEKAKFIVLSRQDFQSWANVSRLDNSGIFFSLGKKLDSSTEEANGLLMLHLLGHAFGLKDEEKFVIAKAQGQPHTPNGPNCAPDEATAEKWWGDLATKYPARVGYFSPCAGSDRYIKPTETSIMNFAQMEKFIPDYGPVSERYLKKILDYCFSGQKVRLDSDPDFFSQYPEFKRCLDRSDD